MLNYYYILLTLLPLFASLCMHAWLHLHVLVNTNMQVCLSKYFSLVYVTWFFIYQKYYTTKSYHFSFIFPLLYSIFVIRPCKWLMKIRSPQLMLEASPVDGMRHLLTLGGIGSVECFSMSLLTLSMFLPYQWFEWLET